MKIRKVYIDDSTHFIEVNYGHENLESDFKELTVLGKKFFGKTQGFLTKITKELEKETMNRVNEFKDNFDKFMNILFNR